MMAGPILCELLLLAPAGLLLLSNKRWLRDIAMSPETTTVAADQVSGKATILPAVCVLPGLGLFLLWPMMTNAQATLTGLLSLSQSPSSLLQATQQILTSLGFAAAGHYSGHAAGAFCLLRDRARTGASADNGPHQECCPRQLCNLPDDSLRCCPLSLG